MSADTRRAGRAACGQMVRPETVTEKSFMESVTGIINEVVPTSYSGAPPVGAADHRETVHWARFEHCDVNDVCAFTDAMEANGNVAPIVLIIGYSTGVQVWLLHGSGEAHEVLSWRQGVVRDARLLPSPQSAAGDLYTQKRPLMAVCDAGGTDMNFSSVGLISLRTGEQVKSVKFKSSISSLLPSKRVLVVTFPGKLAVFDSATFEDRFSVTTCYPAPGVTDNPVALGHRWLAYGEKRLNGHLQSQGGMSDQALHSYTASVLHAAKSIGKGIRELGEGLASTLAGGRYAPPPPPSTAAAAGSASGAPQPGVVTVLDVVAMAKSSASDPGHGIVAHFQAHVGAVVQMCFDASGTLLLTADKAGNGFHVFRVQPHPQRSTLANVMHLYTLYRGDTSAKVLDMSFSLDSRWVSVATHRGTTHVFPICPYGGPISTRTHCGPRVVNKLSRFHRSAGLQDSVCRSGRSSPLSPRSRQPSGGGGGGSGGGGCGGGRPGSGGRGRSPAPPPPPVLVPPLAQLRQPLLTQLTSTTAGGGGSARHVLAARQAPADDGACHVRVVTTFAPSRGWLGTHGAGVGGARERRHWDALYVMANNGSLIEYHIEPRPASVCKERVPDDAPVEVTVHAHAQWSLSRQTSWQEVRPPLATGSALLVAPAPSGSGAGSQYPAAAAAAAATTSEQWVSQVEILSHSGPHRRLWMGPQFSFRPFSDTGHGGVTETRDLLMAARSSPVNMPAQLATHSIECGSANSYEQSPRLIDGFGGDTDRVESQLCQRIADAMSDLGSPSLQHDVNRFRRRQRSGSSRSSGSSCGAEPPGTSERLPSPLDFSEYERDVTAADQLELEPPASSTAGRKSAVRGSPHDHRTPLYSPLECRRQQRTDASDSEEADQLGSRPDSPDADPEPFSAVVAASRQRSRTSYSPHLLDEPLPEPTGSRRPSGRAELVRAVRGSQRSPPAADDGDGEDSSPAATAQSSASEPEDGAPPLRDRFLSARERTSGEEDADDDAIAPVVQQPSRGFHHTHDESISTGARALEGLDREPFHLEREQFEFEREQESGWGEDILCPDPELDLTGADSSSISASDRERTARSSDEETRPTPATKRRGKKKRR